MERRMKALRLFILFIFFCISLKLAYEQLYHAALLIGTIDNSHPFIVWLSTYFVPQ